MRKHRVRGKTALGYTKFKIPYGKNTVLVPYPESPQEYKCDACGRTTKSGQIETTILDHWKLQYRTPTFKKEPWKALENLNELCMVDHTFRLSLIKILNFKENEAWKLVKVALLMPEEMKRKLDKFTAQWRIARRSDRSRRTDLRTFA